MATLSQEQYETLSQQRGAFDDWIRSQACRNLPIPWLNQMNNIHMSVFKSPYVDYHCKRCLGVALTKLHNLLVEYEGEQVKAKQAQETEAVKPGRGRPAKNWIKQDGEEN